MSERELIKRFLGHVERTSPRDGYCEVSYTRCPIGEALVKAGYLTHSRIYPDRWLSCVTQLGNKLRNIAFGSDYIEMDDKYSFHRILQSKTDDAKAREFIGRLVNDATLTPVLSMHYFGDENRVPAIKQLLHSMPAGGSAAVWRKQHTAPCDLVDDPFVVDVATAMSTVTHELADRNLDAIHRIATAFPTKQPVGQLVPRYLEVTWKPFLLQEREAKGLPVNIKVADQCNVTRGPPLHDGLFVRKSNKQQALASAMAKAISNITDVSVDVRGKRINAITVVSKGLCCLPFRRSFNAHWHYFTKYNLNRTCKYAAIKLL